jgi:tungstate transport system substrate-binding protein
MSKLDRPYRWITFILLTLLTGCAAPAGTAPTEGSPAAPTSIPRVEGHLIMATTTSTQDSGLLDAILPDFEKKTGITVDAVAVGTGQAIALGASGDADVLLVHDRAAEDKFVAAGDAAARYDVMYNDFVIVGPADDPAGIKGMTDAAAAFRMISEKGATFISRGDKSGTNARELKIWEAAGITPEGDWYVSAGQGMGEVLTMTEEQVAYTICDRATYLKRKSNGLALEVLVEGDTLLFNPYGVIAVSAEKHPGVNTEYAQQFVEWITSVETQQMIADYEINGTPLFTPNSEAWLKAHPE